MMHNETELPQMLRPMQYTENRLLTLILSGEYPPGSALPNERILAQQLGVTRSTLRETLQRLSREGWVAIQHGKTTRVNDFWQKGGLSLLGTLARYAVYLPLPFIVHLLEARALLMPGFAALAVQHATTDLVDHLKGYSNLGEGAEVFAAFDWELQVHMARAAQNPVCVMILNDFKAIFQQMAVGYFNLPKGRQASRRYYRELADDLAAGAHRTAEIVANAMQESIAIWQEMKPDLQGGGHVSMEWMGR
jgi:GntR family negative regulator for fad regulon and positive regulator of fabA